MPKLTIDGQEVEAPAGTTILQAALSQGAEIPHYCYHPGLSIAGNCRMCLVEVEKAPKLVIACATPVAEGMVVRTANERVHTAHAAVMEFLLINHPLDCTICDQAGECRLQEYAVEHGAGRSRFEEPKQLLNKAVDIGRHIMLDQERCIQCSRCTRFCDEVTGTSELAFFQRGNRTMIGVWPGRPLDNPYSGNVVDLCPVGALTLKEFRFQTRVWYLKNTPSICAGCTRGCNVLVATGRQQEMWTTRGQFDDGIKRIVPRANDDVNGHWMCDEGRLSYLRVAEAERLPMAQAPAGRDASWESTVQRVADSIGTAAKAGRLGAILTPRLTNETLFAWSALFSQFAQLAQLGQVRVATHRLSRGADDALLIRADKGANAQGVAWIFDGVEDESRLLEATSRGELDALVVFGDVLDPNDSPQIDAAARAQLKELIYVGPFLDATARQASLLLPTAAWAEEAGSMVNFQGRVQVVRRAHLARGEGRPGWRVALDVAAAAGHTVAPWTTAEEVFAELADRVAPFAGLGHSALGLLGLPGRATAGAGR